MEVICSIFGPTLTPVKKSIVFMSNLEYVAFLGSLFDVVYIYFMSVSCVVVTALYLAA